MGEPVSENVSPVVCSYVTNQCSNLERHKNTVRKKDEWIECCGLQFPTKAELHAHVNERHNNGSGYTCDICRKNFEKRALFLRHSRIHTGEKRYNCLTCSYKTVHKYNLLRHCVRKLHQHNVVNSGYGRKKEKSINSLSAVSFSSSGYDTEDQPLDLSCKELSLENFTSPLPSQPHPVNQYEFRSSQSVKFWYKCDHCDYRFNEFSDYSIHLLFVHPSLLNS